MRTLKPWIKHKRIVFLIVYCPRLSSCIVGSAQEHKFRVGAGHYVVWGCGCLGLRLAGVRLHAWWWGTANDHQEVEAIFGSSVQENMQMMSVSCTSGLEFTVARPRKRFVVVST